MISLSYAFRVGGSTVSGIIRETCLALWDVLRPEFLPAPTKEKFKQIADEFEDKWNMPHCIGGYDGKHFAIQVKK